MTSPRFVSGILWSMVNAAATVLVPFAIFIFFARVAGPEIVGVVALAAACADVLKTLGMQGIYEALLPRDPADLRHHQTAMAILMAAGVGIGVIYLAVLFGLASFQPGVRLHFGALAFIGLRIPFDLITLQPQAALAQQLLYRRLAVRTLVASVIAGGLGGALTVVIGPLDGLIAYQVLLSAITLIITVFGTSLLARPRFHIDCYRQMAREGWWSTSVRFVAANVVNLDQIIVAAMAGSTQLAYFNLGKRIETSFVSVANAFTSVSFQPLFARHQTVPPVAVMCRSLVVLTLVCGAIAAGFLARGGLLVGVLFGHRWIAAAGIVQVLALSGAVRAIGCVPGALLSVTGRNRQLFAVAVASALGTAAAALFLTPFGVLWCAVGLLGKNVITVVWLAASQRSLIPHPLRVYVSAALLPFGLILCGVALLAFMPVRQPGGVGLLLRFGWLASGTLLGLALAALYAARYLHIGRAQVWAMLRPQRRATAAPDGFTPESYPEDTSAHS